jgi:biotin carboxyl carrier protein
LQDKTQVAAPVPALITELLCKVGLRSFFFFIIELGDKVKTGQELVKLTAMKMVINVPAPFDGTISSVSVKVGDKVNSGILLFKITPLKKD